MTTYRNGFNLQSLPSTEGFVHILVTVCYLSKYVAVRPLKTKTTTEVIENLQDIYLETGLPDIIQHDQGKGFTSGVSIRMRVQRKVHNQHMSQLEISQKVTFLTGHMVYESCACVIRKSSITQNMFYPNY